MPFQFARAHVHDAPQHLVTFAIDICSQNPNNCPNCPNFHIAMSKFPEIRGFAYCTLVARAQCTTTPQVMYHRIALVERNQCTKFRVASSKFPEGEGAYANTQCTCIARTLCTTSPNGMHHRITLIEHHQCTKFGVDR